LKFLRYGPALLLLLFLLVPPTLAAAIHHIRFSASLLSDDGKPQSGFQILTFYIYDNADRRGHALWTEVLPVLVSKDGKYTVELGAGFPRFAEKVIKGHTLLYVSVRHPHSSLVSSAAAITAIPQGIWVDCNPDNSAGNCDGLSGVTSESEIRTIAAAHIRYVFNDSNMWGTRAQIATARRSPLL
jgi:hypothetical protein